ncbi:MAG: hypothetical protein K6B28_08695 [Lachnospiraceae bacterium]|nr:hypothetical protein [Lachnospiraceae bacterium]
MDSSLQTEIATFIGNYIRKNGVVPTIGNVVQEKGLMMVMINMNYIMGLANTGMITTSFYPGMRPAIEMTNVQ